MLLRSLVLSVLALTLTACNLSGTGEKGPFERNSDVALSKLNSQANPIASKTLNTKTYSNRGNYSFGNIRWSGWSQLQVSGKYFNEFTANTSTDVLVLDAITRKDRTFDTANVHIFSHLAAARIRQRVANGQSRMRAWKRTQVEMKQLFGLKRVSQNIHRGVEQLSLLRGRGRYRKDNANLLLFTGSFLAVGGDAASLELLTTDFADDGQINGAGASVFGSIAVMGATDGLLGTLSSNLRNYGIGNPPNNGDMSTLPIWVNQDVADNIAPIVTVNGLNPVIIVVGTPYVDEGASATDNIDGVVDAFAVDGSDVIDTSVIGTHTVTYNAIDLAGNTGSATRIVEVVEAPDTEAPVITLLGGNPDTVEVQTAEVILPYGDAGYTVTDNRDESVSVDVQGAVDTSVLGEYILTYTASDVAGNDVVVSRTVNVVDTTDPVITLNGASAIEVVAGAVYEDAGATATDNYYGNIDVEVSGTVDTNAIGTYTLTFTAEDGSNNTATETRTVTVTEAPDEIAPVITLLGDASVTVEAGTSYTDAGVTASDNKDGDLTNMIAVGGSVNVNAPATYVLTYNVKDAATNPATEVTRTVVVKDTIAPVITLTGEPEISFVEGATYVDAGATASDSLDGDISANIVTAGDTVDVTTPGTYIITYNVTDNAQNLATQVTRTVTVTEAPDEVAPVITLLGDASVIVEAGTSYTDAGATASDNKEGDLTGAIVVGGSVDVNVPATYVLTYNVQDSVPNIAVEVTRTVIVVDTIAPVITLTGDSEVSLVEGTAYTDAGATASDSLDGDISANIVIGGDTVDSTTLGTYTITYNVMDNAQNPATQVTRTVTITEAPDVIAPVITLLGDASVTVEAGTSYTDAGATALDNKEGDLTGAIVVGGSVDVNVPATYVLTYNVQDSVPNIAVEVTRTVIVKDTIVPTITLVGNSELVIQKGSVYTDEGVTASDNLDGDITANIAIDNPVNTNTPATYTITYNVSDNATNSAQTVTRSVRVNAPPVATAGADVSVVTGNSVDLLGTGSDVDGAGTVTYQWKRANNVVATTAAYSYTPEASETLMFVVTDSDGAITTDSVNIEVSAANQPPIANAGEGVTVRRGEVVTLAGIGTDTDGTIASYRWTGTGNFEYATTASFDFDTSNKIVGNIFLTLTVTDNDGATATDQIKITILPALSEPAQLTFPFGNPLVIETGTYASESAFYDYLRANIVVLDQEGNSVNDNSYQFDFEGYSGPVGSAPDGWDNFDPTIAGVGIISIQYLNQYGDGVETELNVTINQNQNQNHIPVANSQPTIVVDEDSSKNVIPTLTATDVDGDTLTFDVFSGSAGATTHGYLELVDDGTKQNYLYTPDEDYFGPDSFSFTVSDGDDVSVPVTINIEVTGDGNHAPVANTQPLITVGEDSSKNVIPTLTATDVDGDTLTFDVISGSAGATTHGYLELVNDGTKQNYLYTPDEDYFGPDSFSFTVSDGDDVSVSVTINIEVTGDGNHAPVANTQALITVDENSSKNVIPTLTATDVDGDTLIFDVISGSAGATTHGYLELGDDGTKQNYLYTPDEDYFGPDSFSFTVSDGDDVSISVTINIEVVEATVNVSAACRATPATELAFSDTFIEQESLDTPWPDNLNNVLLSVDDIANVFNTARADTDSFSLQGKKLIMPTQAVWDGYTNSKKALFLINSERCARGILPYEGVSPLVETSPAQYYADYLSSNNVFGHKEDGSSPWERLAQEAGVVAPTQAVPNPVGENADFFGRAENLAFNSLGSTGESPTVHEPVAKAIYAWMYKDKEDTKKTDPNTGAITYSYGHREFILAKGLIENSGEPNKEGLIGIGVSTVKPTEGGYNWTKVYTVMNAFDPNENWPMGNIQTVELLGSNACLDGYAGHNVVRPDGSTAYVCDQIGGTINIAGDFYKRGRQGPTRYNNDLLLGVYAVLPDGSYTEVGGGDVYRQTFSIDIDSMDLGGATSIKIIAYPVDSDQDPHEFNYGELSVDIVDGKTNYDIGRFYIDDERFQ